MIILLTGSSHTGKTLTAQQLLEKYAYTYISLDFLKMGLIRSGVCTFSPLSPDSELTPYLWNITKEIIKTAIENGQNLVIEGSYIPFTWQKDFDAVYLQHIMYVCLIFSENYINTHYTDILHYACVIEKRINPACSQKELLEENTRNLALCRQYGLQYILMEDTYNCIEKIEQIFHRDMDTQHTSDGETVLRKLQDADIPFLTQWLCAPHVTRWFEHPQAWLDEVTKRHNEFSWLHHQIMEYQGKPIGFCVYYACLDAKEEWYGSFPLEGTYSIDYMIGDGAYIHKGLGKKMVQALINLVQEKEDAQRIIVHPDENNKASCNTLLSLGFVFDEENGFYLLSLSKQ